MKSKLLLSLSLFSVICLIDAEAAEAQLRTPSQSAAQACFECINYIAENWNAERDCLSKKDATNQQKDAADQLFTCIGLCSIAMNKAACEAISAEIDYCCELEALKPADNEPWIALPTTSIANAPLWSDIPFEANE